MAKTANDVKILNDIKKLPLIVNVTARRGLILTLTVEPNIQTRYTLWRHNAAIWERKAFISSINFRPMIRLPTYAWRKIAEYVGHYFQQEEVARPTMLIANTYHLRLAHKKHHPIAYRFSPHMDKISAKRAYTRNDT